jgi:hypothetical protein
VLHHEIVGAMYDRRLYMLDATLYSIGSIIDGKGMVQEPGWHVFV